MISKSLTNVIYINYKNYNYDFVFFLLKEMGI